jgi:hypothetical protein
MKKQPKRAAILNKCEGEAHGNAFIDNCSMCAPLWGRYYTCPDCSFKMSSSGVCWNDECLSHGEKFILPDGWEKA